MTPYEEIVEKLMEYYTSGDYRQEAAQAKEHFYKLAGIFDEESPDFEQKMAQFTDWYVYTRPLQKSSLPPVQYVLADTTYKIPEEQVVYYKNLATNRHSLFELLRVRTSDLTIRDLFSSHKLMIKDSPITEGFAKDEIFEARLVANGDNFLFVGSFCFHPPQASRFIYKEIKKVKKTASDQQDNAREELISRIFRMRHKHEQYKHVEISNIYSNDSKLRL